MQNRLHLTARRENIQNVTENTYHSIEHRGVIAFAIERNKFTIYVNN